MIQKKPRKQKKCKACGILFTPERSFQVVCDYRCGLAHGKELALKSAKRKAAKQHREAKERIKTRAQWMREAQAAVNSYVRERDRNQPCISCGRPVTWNGQWHASHFRSVGAASAVRFNLWNIHKSCSICNNWKSGNLSEYEPRLRAKIGNHKVDWLRAQNHVVTYSIDYLKRIKRIFLKKRKRLLNR